jgi:hypothetical protein
MGYKILLRARAMHHRFSPFSTRADLVRRTGHVQKVPLPDSCIATSNMLLDHLVGADQQCRRKSETERLCRLGVQNEAKPGWLFDREISGLFTLVSTEESGVASNPTWLELPHSPLDCEDPPISGNALERMIAAVAKAQTRTRHQVLDGARH